MISAVGDLQEKVCPRRMGRHWGGLVRTLVLLDVQHVRILFYLSS